MAESKGSGREINRKETCLAFITVSILGAFIKSLENNQVFPMLPSPLLHNDILPFKTCILVVVIGEDLVLPQFEQLHLGIRMHAGRFLPLRSLPSHSQVTEVATVTPSQLGDMLKPRPDTSLPTQKAGGCSTFGF